MGFTIILIFVSLTVYVYFYFSKYRKKRRRIAKLINKFHGEKCFPIIGTALGIMNASRENFYDVLNKRNLKYGPIFRSWLWHFPIIHVMKAELIEPLMKSNANISKGQTYKFLEPWLGQGLISGLGPKWFQHRKLLTPTFHFKILDNFVEVFSEKGQMLAEQFSTLAANGNFFEVFPYVTRCALDIICATAMGVEINSMNQTDSDYVKAIYGISDIIVHRMFRPYLHPNLIFKLSKNGKRHAKYLSILHQFTRQVIQDKKRRIKNEKKIIELSEEEILLGRKKRLAFLDLLLEPNENNMQLTDEELREEVDTFMFAGHDTTTLTICFSLFTIGNYPDVQKKVHQEIDSIFLGEERPVTPEDLPRLKYLEQVIKESLRLYPVVPIISRTLSEDLKIGGNTIPSGVMMVIHLNNLHRDPDQFPNPMCFDPDRFLPERSAERHPYSYIPFSAGPRNCLGQKFAIRAIKVILALILRRFTITAKDTPESIKFYPELVMKPQNGMKMSFKPRTYNK